MIFVGKSKSHHIVLRLAIAPHLGVGGEGIRKAVPTICSVLLTDCLSDVSQF